MSDWPARSTDDVEFFEMLDEVPPSDRSGRRQLTGFAVIALAVVAVLLVVVGHQRTVTGAAVVPPRPQIGDCVSISAIDPVWQQTNPEEVPVLVSAPCAGARDGEVVSVENHIAARQDDCWTPTIDYLGLPARNESVPESGTAWVAKSLVMSYTFGPSPLQVAAGQSWSACVVLGIAPGDFRPQPLAESPRDAATRGGTAFEKFAFCSDSPLSNTLSPCGEPHRYEVVADGFNLGPSEPDSLDSCLATVSQLTGLADPSAGGRLRVQLVAYVWDDGASSARASTYQQARTAGSSVMCAVSPTAPDQALSSTLVGLGERPLPIT